MSMKSRICGHYLFICTRFGDFVYIIYIYEVDKMTFVVLC